MVSGLFPVDALQQQYRKSKLASCWSIQKLYSEGFLGKCHPIRTTGDKLLCADGDILSVLLMTVSSGSSPVAVVEEDVGPTARNIGSRAGVTLTLSQSAPAAIAAGVSLHDYVLYRTFNIEERLGKSERPLVNRLDKELKATRTERGDFRVIW
ncbi:hypothetical protein JB92DRAFT_3098596 [Gautieria morchelliformis]|nr:hypothetical protein JB92DRAFT_3098596 [Gautieria morchelliformis]